VAPASNTLGWINTDATVTFACQDAASGIVSCPEPATISDERSDQQIARTVYDRAGNAATVTATINLDRTAPQLGTPTWSTNPSPAGTGTTLSVPVTDNLSGVVSGEYFFGADPGVGHGTVMTVAGGSLTAVLGADLPVGSHTVGLRAVDAAGNWTAATTTTLAVYNPAISDIAVTASANPSPASLGNTYTFTLTVTNNGPQPATAVTTTTEFTGAGRLVFGTGASQGTCTVGTNLTCTLGTLASGASASITVTVEPQATGTVTATSSATAVQSDPQPANNTVITQQPSTTRSAAQSLAHPATTPSSAPTATTLSAHSAATTQ
jgi:hypothetical protein